MRLLILEDDAQLGEALCAGLRQLGHVVDWFADGEHADQAVRTASYAQVRQPLHARSSGRWRRYETQLAPLLRALEPN